MKTRHYLVLRCGQLRVTQYSSLGWLAFKTQASVPCQKLIISAWAFLEGLFCIFSSGIYRYLSQKLQIPIDYTALLLGAEQKPKELMATRSKNVFFFIAVSTRAKSLVSPSNESIKHKPIASFRPRKQSSIPCPSKMAQKRLPAFRGRDVWILQIHLSCAHAAATNSPVTIQINKYRTSRVLVIDHLTPGSPPSIHSFNPYHELPLAGKADNFTVRPAMILSMEVLASKKVESCRASCRASI